MLKCSKPCQRWSLEHLLWSTTTMFFLWYFLWHRFTLEPTSYQQRDVQMTQRGCGTLAWNKKQCLPVNYYNPNLTEKNIFHPNGQLWLLLFLFFYSLGGLSGLCESMNTMHLSCLEHMNCKWILFLIPVLWPLRCRTMFSCSVTDGEQGLRIIMVRV